MRYQVPQYIGVEDKLIFGLTVKQFLYILIPILAFVYFYSLKKWPIGRIILMEIILIPYAYLSAFVQINGQKFNTVLINAINYRLKARFYLWRKMSRVKIFPEPDISLFHKKFERKISQREVSRQIVKITKKIEGK